MKPSNHAKSPDRVRDFLVIPTVLGAIERMLIDAPEFCTVMEEPQGQILFEIIGLHRRMNGLPTQTWEETLEMSRKVARSCRTKSTKKTRSSK